MVSLCRKSIDCKSCLDDLNDWWKASGVDGGSECCTPGVYPVGNFSAWILQPQDSSECPKISTEQPASYSCFGIGLVTETNVLSVLLALIVLILGVGVISLYQRRNNFSNESKNKVGQSKQHQIQMDPN